jgi:hypothetical protein
LPITLLGKINLHNFLAKLVGLGNRVGIVQGNGRNPFSAEVDEGAGKAVSLAKDHFIFLK